VVCYKITQQRVQQVVDLFCAFLAIKIFSFMLRCGFAVKQRVGLIAKFILNETLESETFAFNLSTGPSPGFCSKGSKITRGAHL